MTVNANKYLHGLVLGAAFTLFSGATVAQDRRDDRNRADDRGRPEDRRPDDRRGQDQSRREDDRDRHDQRRMEYRFRAEDRDHFSRHYEKDIRRWRQHPDRRHQLRAGERLPGGVRLKSVPSSYYRSLPPPPRGYRFGYYDGYVVAYDPTTQIVADVLDLVNTVVNR